MSRFTKDTQLSLLVLLHEIFSFALSCNKMMIDVEGQEKINTMKFHSLVEHTQCWSSVVLLAGPHEP